MKSVRIDSGTITDWDSFHDVFQQTLGFPGYYSRNLNAWIDCMTYLDEPESGMTKITVEPEELLLLSAPRMPA